MKKIQTAMPCISQYLKIVKGKFLLLILASLFFSGCEISDSEITAVEKLLDTSEISEENFTYPSTNLETESTEKSDSDKNLYDIEYVYDGDTYQIWINGKKEKIRVLGIDTPEKTGGFRPEGCFGNDASAYAKKKLRNKKVGLLQPKNHESTDKYGRLLRYVFLDGEDFGAHLIQEGYAFSYKRFPHPRLKYYNQLEKEAQKNKKGMWNPDNCEYWGQNNLID